MRVFLPAMLFLASPALSAQHAAIPETPGRIVAIGDLHGDLTATLSALRLAGAVDSVGRWIGGTLTVVQTGDIFDRGHEESRVLELFTRLKVEAKRAGGVVHVLNGNHELMNAYFDFRYVTDAGFRDFVNELPEPPSLSFPDKVTPEQRRRALAFRPGGPIAMTLATQRTMLVLGKNAFVHGGILPVHAKRGIDGMNEEVRAWLRGEGEQPQWIRGDESPVWTRLYSKAPDAAACATAREALNILGAERMVVGHSVHKDGITAYCDGAIWAIDVGMAAYYRGSVQVLEIQGDSVRAIKPVGDQ